MDVQAQRRPILPGARRGSRKKVSSASRSLISLEYRYDPSADDDVPKTEEVKDGKEYFARSKKSVFRQDRQSALPD